MKLINTILLAVVVIFCIAAGAAKIMQLPQEINFLQSVGLSSLQIMIFGIMQLLGGLLVAIRRTRVIGCMLVVVALLIMAFYIFIAGDTQSGLFALAIVLLVLVVAYQAVRAKQ